MMMTFDSVRPSVGGAPPGPPGRDWSSAVPEGPPNEIGIELSGATPPSGDSPEKSIVNDPNGFPEPRPFVEDGGAGSSGPFLFSSFIDAIVSRWRYPQGVYGA